MNVIRHHNQSTSANVQALLDVASNPLTVKVQLACANFRSTPFLAACVTTTMSRQMDPIMIVFDGNFLTAATTAPRADEITAVLDQLVNDPRVSILLDPLMDTSLLQPEEVVKRFASVDCTPLIDATRQTLEGLLRVFRAGA